MKINQESLMRIGVMLALAVLLTLGLTSGKINQYVHPRMNLYIGISIVLLGIMTLFEIPHLKRVKHKNHIKLYSVMLIPMILFFILPKAGSDLSNGSRKNIVVGSSMSQGSSETQSLDYGDNGQQNNTQDENFQQSNKAEGRMDNSEESSMTQDELAGSQEDAMQEEQSTGYEDGCVVQDDDYGRWFLEVYDHMEAYDGNKVTLKVQVLHDKSLQNNEMVGVRAIMTCCVADLQYYGYVCRGEGLADLEENSWVWVTGTLHVENYLQRVEPIILVENVTPADAPIDEYAYF